MKNYQPNKSKLLGKVICLVAGILFLPSCSVVSLSTNWEKPGYTGKEYKKIAVVAIMKDRSLRRLYESNLASALEGRGCAAVMSMDVLPEASQEKNEKPDVAEIRRKFDELGVDGVITMRLASVQRKTEYVPPTYGAVPMGGYYDFWGYYPMMYSTMYSPGYYEERKIAYIETNFYQNKQRGLIWNAMAEVDETDSLISAADDLAKTVTKELLAKKIILPCQS